MSLYHQSCFEINVDLIVQLSDIVCKVINQENLLTCTKIPQSKEAQSSLLNGMNGKFINTWIPFSGI